MAAMAALPDPDLLTPSTLDDPLDGGQYYSASTLLKLLAAQRERLAKLCDAQAIDCQTWDEGAGGDGGRKASHMCAAAIRKG